MLVLESESYFFFVSLELKYNQAYRLLFSYGDPGDDL